MADYRVQIALGTTTGLDEDRMVNVWHVRTPSESGNGTEETAQDIIFPFGVFYQELDANLTQFVLSNATNAHSVKVYALAKGAAGEGDDVATLLVEDFLSTPGLNNAQALPNETAICLSMASDPESVAEFAGNTRPRSRRRGRIYIGGLCADGTLHAVADGAVRPTATFRTAILDAAENLVTGLGAVSPVAELCVYSRTDGAMRAVTEFSVDNAYDTVRSRGPAPTVRSVRTL